MNKTSNLFPKLNFDSKSMNEFNIKQKNNDDSILLDNSFVSDKKKNDIKEESKPLNCIKYFILLFKKIKQLFNVTTKTNILKISEYIINDKSFFPIINDAKKVNIFQIIIIFLSDNKIICDPFSYFSIIWTIIDLTYFLIIIVIIPINLIMDTNFNFRILNYMIIDVLSTFFILFSLLNIIKTSITFNLDKGLQQKNIIINIKNYFKSQFILDLLSLVILNIYLYDNENFSDNQKKYFILIILARINCMQKNITIIKKFFLTEKYYLLLKIFITFIIYIHYCACIWFYISSLLNNSWMKYYKLENKSKIEKYIYCFYFIITFGSRLKPQNVYEILFCCFFIIFSLFFLIYIFNLIYLLSNIKMNHNYDISYSKKIIPIYNFFKKNQMDNNLKANIINYIQYSHKQEKLIKQYNKYEFKTQLPKNLRNKLYYNSENKIINNLKIFSNNFSKEFLKRLNVCISEVKFKPNDLIFKEKINDDKDLYIIREGEIELGYENFGKIKSLKQNDFFGEISFFSNISRIISAKSIGFSTLLKIEKSKFLKILKSYYFDYQKFKEIEDQINIYKNFSFINLTCYLCEKNSHLIEECPLIHYVPDKIKIVRNFITDKEKNEKRNIFIRRNKKDKIFITSLFKMKKKNSTYFEENKNKILFLDNEDDDRSSESSDFLIKKLSREYSDNILTIHNFINSNSNFDENFEKIQNFKNYFTNNNFDKIVKTIQSNLYLSKINTFRLLDIKPLTSFHKTITKKEISGKSNYWFFLKKEDSGKNNFWSFVKNQLKRFFNCLK